LNKNFRRIPQWVLGTVKTEIGDCFPYSPDIKYFPGRTHTFPPKLYTYMHTIQFLYAYMYNPILASLLLAVCFSVGRGGL